ncbi:M23 family metallopeptidase [Nocardia wallacei]|uniref:M23 family metallopeptidase n=1 Tax=Nocardia wallacei TaxID=480035 RepID=UPI002454D874|nr:M23 family metallopeptidase [Nocardia wallacei]
MSHIYRPMRAGDYTLTSGFAPRWGSFHYGQDFGSTPGKPIYAAADGGVVLAGPASGFGCWIVIDHQAEHDVDTVYGHMFPQDILVSIGQTLRAGDLIARVGYNGGVVPNGPAGAHLHFETWSAPGRLGGSAFDPMPWLDEHGALEPGGPPPAPAEPEFLHLLDYSGRAAVLAGFEQLLPFPPSGAAS